MCNLSTKSDCIILWQWLITRKHNEGQIPFFEYDSETAAPEPMCSVKELHVFFCILTTIPHQKFFTFTRAN